MKFYSYLLNSSKGVNPHYMPYMYRSGVSQIGCQSHLHLHLIGWAEAASEPSAVHVGKLQFHCIAAENAVRSAVAHFKPQVAVHIGAAVANGRVERSCVGRVESRGVECQGITIGPSMYVGISE